MTWSVLVLRSPWIPKGEWTGEESNGSKKLQCFSLDLMAGGVGCFQVSVGEFAGRLDVEDTGRKRKKWNKAWIWGLSNQWMGETRCGVGARMKFLGHIKFLYIREEKLSRQLGKEV